MHSTSSAGGLLFGLLTRSSEDENARPDDDEDPPALRDDAFPLRCEFVVAGRVSCPCPPRGGQVADSGGRLIELTTESGCGCVSICYTLVRLQLGVTLRLFTLRFSSQPSSPQVGSCGYRCPGRFHPSSRSVTTSSRLGRRRRCSFGPSPRCAPCRRSAACTPPPRRWARASSTPSTRCATPTPSASTSTRP